MSESKTVEICPVYDRVRNGETTTVDTCTFYDVVSDGHRYVWTAGKADESRVQLFDIDTGHHVGYLPSCHEPIDFDYHPGRREMYVICYDNSVVVYSVDAIGKDAFQTISTFAAGAGRVIVHDTLGSVGYVASPYDPLAEIDLSNQTIKETFEHPDANGFHFATYSPVNRHVYMRATICCACGFEGADTERECPSFGPQGVQDIKHGPFKGRTDINGACGSRCYGTAADAVGIVEFDTVSKTFVNQMKIDSGMGAQPYASPDGQYIIVAPGDGGKVVRLLMPDRNGQPSVRCCCCYYWWNKLLVSA